MIVKMNEKMLELLGSELRSVIELYVKELILRKTALLEQSVFFFCFTDIAARRSYV